MKKFGEVFQLIYKEMPINEAKQMGAMALFGENTEILCALLIWHRSH